LKPVFGAYDFFSPRVPDPVVALRLRKTMAPKKPVTLWHGSRMTLQLAGDYQQSNAVLNRLEENWIVSTLEG